MLVVISISNFYCLGGCLLSVLVQFETILNVVAGCYLWRLLLLLLLLKAVSLVFVVCVVHGG